MTNLTDKYLISPRIKTLIDHFSEDYSRKNVTLRHEVYTKVATDIADRSAAASSTESYFNKYFLSAPLPTTLSSPSSHICFATVKVRVFLSPSRSPISFSVICPFALI